MGLTLDQMLEAWRRSPDERSAIALCERLAGANEPKLVEEIGKEASTRYGSNAHVLIAVGQMYLGAARLGDAQGILVAAGKMMPRNGEVYRWLGEVLLRRGDAERALKVLDRAVTLGRTDGETELWRERAEKYAEMQKQAGPQAVAAETARVLPRATGRSVIPKAMDPSDAEFTTVDRRPGVSHGGDEGDGRLSDSDIEEVEHGAVPQAIRPGSDADVTVVRKATMVMDYRVDAVERERQRRALRPPLEPARPISVSPPASLSSRGADAYAQTSLATHGSGSRRTLSPLPPPPSFSNQGQTVERSGALFSDLARPAPFGPPRGAPGSIPPPKPLYGSKKPSLPPPPSYGADHAWSGGSVPPQTHDVLNALAITGVFEPSAGGAPTWDAPPKVRSRFVVRLIAFTCLLIGGGIAVLSYVRDKRAKQADEARTLCAEVEASLRAGKVKDFAIIETKLSRAFDLDPNNPRAALLWVRERVLRAIESESESQGIDSAIGRARQAGVSEEDLAFARIGSFLAQGDTAGGAALVPQWDDRVKKDPYFQLLAGAALERAGDLRALERYQLAVNLDPELVAARVLVVRAIILEADPAKGLELARDLRNKWGDRPEGPALIALAWARDPARGPSPIEADQAKSRRSELPLALQPVPSAVEALEAMQRRADVEAKAALNRALTAATTPGVATWLGSIALALGDDEMARRAALQAVAFSAIYPQARVLAARVALAGGRLDEALKAVSELEANLPDVAIVRATVAYERQDLGALSLALDALSPELRSRPELAALVRGADVLRGDVAFDSARLKKMASPEVAWGDLIAADAALESGNLAAAKELIDKFAKDKPPRALRLARLLRYMERPQEADEPSRTAFAGLASPAAVIERVMVLLALEKVEEARGVVVKGAPQLGPMGSWLLAYVDADGPRAAEARAKAASLEVPPSRAPVAFRLLAAMALADLGDKRRGGELLRSLARQLPKNPDVFIASRSLKQR
jgi:tetratricopeptide (TPR) repeat protein